MCNIKRFLAVLIEEVEPLQQTEACARHCIESVSFSLCLHLSHRRVIILCFIFGTDLS